MKRIFCILLFLLPAAAAVCMVIYRNVMSGPWLSLSITFWTTWYHIAFRMAVGYGLYAGFHNHMDYRRRWFCEKHFEKHLYRFLRVHRWKKIMPAFQPEWFDIRRHSLEEVIMAGCEAEVGHEINIVLSFVPLFLIPYFGSTAAFAATSVIAAAADLAFVIIQRYNRPRLLRVMSRSGT